MFVFDALAALPYQHGRPTVSGGFKGHAEDFAVTEILGYEPPLAQQQEHLWLQIQKTGQNTSWLAAQLARHFKRPLSDVSYAGLKDRQAVTRQWFSVRLADPELTPKLSLPGVDVIDQTLAAKKLQRGALRGNHFEIYLRDISQPQLLQQRFEDIVAASVPNYFGSQRFGHGAANLWLAERWRRGKYRPRNRAEKGFLISAMRAWLFNLQVAEGLASNAAADGFLFGAMRFALPVELTAIAKQYDAQIQWLVGQGCKMQKRPLQLVLQQPEIAWQQNDAVLSFELPAGSYATAVLRELLLV